MLKSTFDIYLSKFSENIRILTPIIILEVLLWIMQATTDMAFISGRYLVLLIIGLGILALTLVHWLIYSPATIRTFQKRADGEAVSIQQSIAFQKNNKWNYVVLTFWMTIYMLWYGLISFLPIIAGMYFGLGFAQAGGMANMFAGTTIMFIGVGFGLYMIYKNYPKIFFPLNVYFAKEKSPRESIEESIALGRTYRNQIWKYMIGAFLICIVGFVLIMGPALAVNNKMVMSIWQLAVSLLFITPMLYIYMSKAYLSILVLNEMNMQNGNGPTVVEEVEIVEIANN